MAESVRQGKTIRDGAPAGLRAADGRGARRPPHPALVHRRPRPAEVLRHHPRRARERLRGGHDLRRLLHRRLLPGAGERRARHARPQHASSCCPWVDPTAPAARMFCDIAQPRRHAVRGRPPPGPEAQPRRARERGFSFYVSPPRWSSSTSRERRSLEAARSPSTTAPTSTSPPPTSPATCASAPIQTLETMGIPVEYSFHEDSPSQHEIDLRYTDALSMADNVMTFRLVVREIAPRSRACTPRSCRSRWKACRARACTPTCRSSKATRTPSTRPATRSALQGRPRLHRRAAAHAREITAITNQTVNSYKRLIAGLRGARVRGVGPQQPLGPGAGARHQAGQGVLDPHRVPGARPGLQPLPRLLGDAGRRAEGHRGGLRAAAGGRRRTSSS